MLSGCFIDVAIVAFLLLQTFLGWRRGLLWQAAGVASVVFGVLLGWALAPALSLPVNRHIAANPAHARLVAFLFVLAAVGFVLRIVAACAEVRSEQGLEKQERELRRAKDRILGGIFGALKGSFLALILIAAAAACFPQSGIWPSSALAAPLARAGSRLLPEGTMQDMAHWADRSVADIRKQLDGK